jgi:ribulose-5-phosphate 4-epimerase/fuculose-1-phosphate aldolase
MVAVSQSLREQVALACRILASEGYADLTLGHVSAREPGASVVEIKRKGVSLEEVSAADVRSLPLDSAAEALAAPDMHLEAVLHTEVYAARPDVNAVVHGHPTYATAFAAADARLEFLTHDAVLFVEGIPVFDETAELITNGNQARAVAGALGNRRAVIMRNHGVLVVGKSVPWAVLTAVTLERALRMQVLAARLGPLRPMPAEIARRMFAEKYQDSLVDEYWSAWLRRLSRAEGNGAGSPS